VSMGAQGANNLDSSLLEHLVDSNQSLIR
jgi:hypothetical protein